MQSPTCATASAALQSQSAVAELRHLLLSSSCQTHPAPHSLTLALAHATATSAGDASGGGILQQLRASGDVQLLFLRGLIELVHTTAAAAATTSSPSASAAQQREEESFSQQLLFHCVLGTRDVLLQRFDGFPVGFVHAVRDYLHFVGFLSSSSGSGGTGIPRAIRRVCLSSSAALWKRGWLSSPQQQQQQSQNQRIHSDEVLTAVTAMMYPPQQPQPPSPSNTTPTMYNTFQDMLAQLDQLVVHPLTTTTSSAPATPFDYETCVMGCSFLSELLEEFSSAGTASDRGRSSPSKSEGANRAVTRYGMSLEFHTRARRAFEQDPAQPPPSPGPPGAAVGVGVGGLDPCLAMGMRALESSLHLLRHHLSTSPSTSSQLLQTVLDVSSAAAQLVSSAISWEFHSTSTVSTSLRYLPPRWRPLLLRQDVLQLVLEVYGMVRNSYWNACSSSSSSLSSNPTMGFAAGTAAAGGGGLQEKDAMVRWSHNARQLLLQFTSISLHSKAFRRQCSKRDYFTSLLSPTTFPSTQSQTPTQTPCQDGIFTNDKERYAYLSFLYHAFSSLAQSVMQTMQEQKRVTLGEVEAWMNGETVHVATCLVRLLQNGHWKVLVRTPLLLQVYAAQQQDQQQQQQGQQQQQEDLLAPFLQTIQSLCSTLLAQNVHVVTTEASLKGDVEAMMEEGGGEYREAAAEVLLEGCAFHLGEDDWLLNGSGRENGSAGGGGDVDVDGRLWKEVVSTIAPSFSSMYTSYLSCRIQLFRLEEYHLIQTHTDLDEVRETITSLALEEQMMAVSSLGRLHLQACLHTLGTALEDGLRRYKEMLNGNGGVGGGGEITPDGAALLEEVRMLIEFVRHLLTDPTEGEIPLIPQAILNACVVDGGTAQGIQHVVEELLMSLGEFQAQAIAQRPHDVRLSPYVAKGLLMFFASWSCAYLCPVREEYSYGIGGGGEGTMNSMLSTWSHVHVPSAPTATSSSAQRAVYFCSTLCLHYTVYWPQEGAVQEACSALLQSLASRGGSSTGEEAGMVRHLLASSPSFQQLVLVHVAAAGVRPGPTTAGSAETDAEVDAAIHTASVSLSSAMGTSAPLVAGVRDMVKGYRRLPYDARRRMVAALVMGCSNVEDGVSTGMFGASLEAVRGLFGGLYQALCTKQIDKDDPQARDATMLSLEMLTGIAQCSSIPQPQRLPSFFTPLLPNVATLMQSYGEDLTICQLLLRFFCDYAQQFVALLNREQSIVLFRASADLLAGYATMLAMVGKVKRGVSTEEDPGAEERSYNDVLCAIQLLTHLGTKDFIDICGDEDGSGSAGGGVESDLITEVIFTGLRQILPLMTGGLLQFPTLCTQFFALVGFMMDTYPEKARDLPSESYFAFMDALLFGMTHVDAFVGKTSLQGIGAVAAEQLRTGRNSQAMQAHLAARPSLFQDVSLRLLQEVVFRPVVWDRLEAAGMALLPLVAMDTAQFVSLVNGITSQLTEADKRQRFLAAFERLFTAELMEKIAATAGGSVGGYQGRMVRIRFKREFEVFVKEVHSFLILH